jgi:hypothetical protein
MRNFFLQIFHKTIPTIRFYEILLIFLIGELHLRIGVELLIKNQKKNYAKSLHLIYRIESLLWRNKHYY